MPPYNDEHIIAGQGTTGLEILEDCPDVELVLVPVGGGGLISGVATAIKLSGSTAKIVGVEPELANDAQQSFRKGEIVQLPAERVSSTLADGLRTQSVGSLNFEHIRKYVDDIITVTEDEIRDAVRRIVKDSRIVAEPSGAVTFAAWLFHRDELPASKKTVAVVSGGNIEPQLLAQILSEDEAPSECRSGFQPVREQHVVGKSCRCSIRVGVGHVGCRIGSHRARNHYPRRNYLRCAGPVVG